MTAGADAQLLSTNAVAKLLGVHPKHVYRLLKRGLPAHRLGGEWRFQRDEVLAWMEPSARARSATAQASPPPLLAANGDVCVELLLELLSSHGRVPFGLVQADRTSGRAHVERGAVLAAGVHGDDASGEIQVGSTSLVKLHVTRRSVGVAFAKQKKPRSLRAAQGLRWASRAKTAGLRMHLEQALAAEGIDSEELHQGALVCASHRDVALSLLSGQAQAGVLTEAWAERAGLGFLPLADEDYALCLRADALTHELGRSLVQVLQGGELKRHLARVGGYQPRRAGTLL